MSQPTDILHGHPLWKEKRDIQGTSLNIGYGCIHWVPPTGGQIDLHFKVNSDHTFQHLQSCHWTIEELRWLIVFHFLPNYQTYTDIFHCIFIVLILYDCIPHLQMIIWMYIVLRMFSMQKLFHQCHQWLTLVSLRSESSSWINCVMCKMMRKNKKDIADMLSLRNVAQTSNSIWLQFSYNITYLKMSKLSIYPYELLEKMLDCKSRLQVYNLALLYVWCEWWWSLYWY